MRPSGIARAARWVISIALTAIADRQIEEMVVAVTHGGFLMGFFEHVLGLTPCNGWRFKKRNASYDAFGYQDGRWYLESWNDTAHLRGHSSLDDPGVEQPGLPVPPCV